MHQVYSLAEQNRFYKKAAAFVLRAVAKHSPQLAQVRSLASALRAPLFLQALRFAWQHARDSGEQLTAAACLPCRLSVTQPHSNTHWCGRHTQAVVDCGALDSLVACLEEFDPGVREAAAWALGYVAGHSAELAQTVRACFSQPQQPRPGAL